MGYRRLASASRCPSALSRGEAETVIGRAISHYRILEKLGEGGMGVVYKARDTRLDRIVALKVAKSEFGKRFEREAKAVAALNHPCICTLYDVGPNYLVMEYIDGTPIRGPASAEKVLPYALQICDALAAAHEKGITHRDLKPANILLTKTGIKLLDFGLAKVRILSEDLAATQTKSETILGTPAYMSPEQAQSRPVDARSDIFSFGSLLYELLTGRQAFGGPNVASILASLLHDEPPPLKNAPEMQRVIARCLRKHPVDRYQSVTDLRAALEDYFLSGAAASGPCNGPVPKPRPMHPEWPRPIPAQAPGRPLAVPAGANWIVASSARFKHGFIRTSSAWGAIAFVSLAVIVALWFAAENARSKEPSITQITATLAENRVTAAAVSPEGRTLAYAELEGSLIVQDLNSGSKRVLRAPERTLIDAISWLGTTGKILIGGETNAGARTLWVEDLSNSQLYTLRQNARRVTASPDGHAIAFTSGDETEIWIMKADGGDARKLVIGGSADTFPFIAFSADGRRVSYQRRHYTTDSIDSRTRNDGENNFRRTFETVDLSGRIIETAAIGMTSGCMLSDGRILFLQPEERNGHHFNVWELRTHPRTGKLKSAPRRLTKWPEKIIAGISCSADGGFVGFLVQSGQSDVYLADPSSGSLQNVRRLTQEDMPEYPHAWTRDSQAVIFEKPGKSGWDLFIQGVDDRLAHPLVTGNGSKIMPQLSPDGEWVLFSSFRDNSAASRADQKLMRVPATGGPQQLVPTGQFDEFRCALTPGRRCVLRTIENRQHVYWELDPVRGRGQELARTAWAPSILGDWALSADGAEAAIPVHDPRQARILLVALHAPPGQTPATRELQVPGLAGLLGLIADANDTGWFASATLSRGVKLLHINRAGQFRVLRECPIGTWALPSPDGRRLAFVDQSAVSNFWSIELF
jgi:Tol biopolymer transport system component/tRNA A-37 threonylcarbamoyl transferase component Bud32